MLVQRGGKNQFNSLFKIKQSRDFPGSPVVKTLLSTAGYVGSITRWGIKIPLASWRKTKKHKAEAIL